MFWDITEPLQNVGIHILGLKIKYLIEFLILPFYDMLCYFMLNIHCGWLAQVADRVPN